MLNVRCAAGKPYDESNRLQIQSKEKKHKIFVRTFKGFDVSSNWILDLTKNIVLFAEERDGRIYLYMFEQFDFPQISEIDKQRVIVLSHTRWRSAPSPHLL